MKNGANQQIKKIRHSLAHLLAMAVLRKFPEAKLGIGPIIENGFYYDFLLPRNLTPEDLVAFEETMRNFIGQNLDFRGKKIAALQAKKLFAEQPFKLELIKDLIKKRKPLKIFQTDEIFTDLCEGGHIRNTEEIDPEAFKLTKIAGAYWRGDEKNPQLQRIYGVAFETKKELDDFLHFQNEIEKRDHRRLGERLDLFHFEDIAPGAAFWHHKGMIIWRELEKFMREKLDSEDYQEISTPIMVKKSLFEKSGHWQLYRENMFYFTLPDEPNETYILKPMNCPESAYIYNLKIRSYRDLPLRLSEITDRLHRRELSGVIGGLLRVRQMTQDDAHIYCRPDQIENEIQKLISLIKEVYQNFNLALDFNLATKPDKALGEPGLWRKAETALERVLKLSGQPYRIKPKDGAFYGPKIDVNIKDAIGREWAIATIQLDFQMPERFALCYIDEKSKKQRPVIIHRAILGTFERFIGIILEHFEGKLPLWLSPVQAVIINIGANQQKYAQEIFGKLKAAGIRTELSDENLTVAKRIREAEMHKIPYILVIGDNEIKNQTVNVRHYRRGQENEIKIDLLLKKLSEEIKNKII